MGSSSCSSGSPPLIPGLPDDVGVQCLARVPRVFHPTVSLVCRSWNSLLRSQLFLSTRSLLQASEPFLYLLVRTHDTTSSLSWFALHHHDHFRHTFSLPLMPSTPVGPACAALGTRLFVLGGSVNEIPTHTVWIYDAVLNRWDAGPNMRVAREFAAAGEIDGKIYVVGGCQPDSWARSNSWAEVFDPQVGRWAPVPSPIEIRDKWMHGNAVLGGKLLAMADRGGVAYDPRTCSWSCVSCELDSGWRGRAAVVGGILYCYDYLGKIRGFDPDGNQWKKLKGVKRLPKFLCGATLANVGESFSLCGREMATVASIRELSYSVQRLRYVRKKVGNCRVSSSGLKLFFLSREALRWSSAWRSRTDPANKVDGYGVRRLSSIVSA